MKLIIMFLMALKNTYREEHKLPKKEKSKSKLIKIKIQIKQHRL